ncbi:MAG: phospholipase A [Prevotella sp.]|nr:phospholipase A [Prevotella sp.]MCM1074371.1 phospholipase A [Ruminococcus sp.]
MPFTYFNTQLAWYRVVGWAVFVYYLSVDLERGLMICRIFLNFALRYMLFMKIIRIIFILLLAFAAAAPANAQIIKTETQEDITDSLRQQFDNGPYFTLYRDNYFAVGTDPTHKPTANNSDVRFQISIAQRLTKSVLPWHTYLFLCFTQGVAWDVFKNSMPMHDFTFNPGLGIVKPLFNRDRFIGKATLMIEHMSNGRDSIWSRSWNRIALGATIMITENVTIDGKAWIPIVDGQNNKDILKYVGLFQGGVSVFSNNRRWGGSLHLVKRAKWNLSFNTEVQFFWRPWKQANEFLFLQWFNGYGETLIDYNHFSNRLRVGLLIKPRFFSDY